MSLTDYFLCVGVLVRDEERTVHQQQRLYRSRAQADSELLAKLLSLFE